MMNVCEPKKILVVDDDNDIRYLVQVLLTKMGHEVYQASNGEGALEILSELIPHLVITDAVMPSMNGYELLKRLKVRPETSEIPVIMLTAAKDEIDGLTVHPDGYLAKPFSLFEFWEKVGRFLSE
jgi:two-component system, OmpR family, phosphate regulon response regulator PhoB